MEKLIITLKPQGYNVKGLARQNISRFFIGKSYEEVEKQITNLFVFCGSAHLAAFQAASQRPVTADWQQDYQKALLWRLCLDWPRFLNQPLRTDILKDFLKGKASYKQSRTLLFEGKKEWQEDIYKYNKVAYAIYKKAEYYEGEIFENERGAHTKYKGQLKKYPPLLRRFMGQIYDCFFYDGYDFAIQNSEEGGVYVPTARGALFYQLAYEKGKINHCRILSPTDAHFGSISGFIKRGQGNIEISKEQLALEIMSLDPCMQWELKENA